MAEKRKFTISEKVSIARKMMTEGRSNKEIGERLGIPSISGVSHFIRTHLRDIARPSRDGWSEAEREILRQMWAKDVPMSEIEQAFAYKGGNIRTKLYKQMSRMRQRGIETAKRTINGVRKI